MFNLMNAVLFLKNGLMQLAREEEAQSTRSKLTLRTLLKTQDNDKISKQRY